MKRSLLCSALAGVLMWSGCSRGLPDGEDSPNPDRQLVLLVVLDTFRADRMGIYGHRGRLTPNLDRLGREGIVFDSAYATSNHTRPSVASIITGLYPSNHGFWWDTGGPIAEPNVASLFKSLGFRTLFVNANPLMTRYVPAFDAWWSEYPPLDTIEADFYPATQVRLRLRRLLLEHNDPDRLFAFVQVADTHAPYLPARYDEDIFRDDPIRDSFTPALASLRVNDDLENLTKEELQNVVNRYDAEVRELDDDIWNLIREMQRRYPKHLIIVTADHGEAFLEHGDPAHGTSLYEAQIKVPLILFDSSGRLESGLRVERLTSLIDLLPTLADYFGASIPAVDGESFFDEVRDDGIRDALEWFTPRAGRSILVESTYPVDDYRQMGAPSLRNLRVSDDVPDPLVRAVLYQRARRGRVSSPIYKSLQSYGDPAILSRLERLIAHDDELFEVITDPGERINRFVGQRALAHQIVLSLDIPHPDIPRNLAPLSPEQRERLRALGYVR